MEKSTYETTQDIEDQYACPENVLEIEVRSPETRNHESERYTDYEIICRTNIPTYKKAHSIVRRRYSEFVRLHDVLVRENPGVRIPDIPPKRFFENRFKEDVIEERRAGFLKFLQAICTHPIIQNGRSARLIVSFLQDPTN